MMLRGILARTFNNILCLRGFAPLMDLARLSNVDESYQRQQTKTHSDEITEFLDSGNYTFFPEVILGASLASMGFKEEDIKTLYDAADIGNGFTRTKLGVISVSTFVKGFKSGPNMANHVVGSFYELESLGEGSRFVRIDGNHRLQAVFNAKDSAKKYQAPFCLVLFRDDYELKKFGRVFFHNINFRALPIPEEKNLELILENREDYPDNLLYTDHSFGREYVLSRNIMTLFRSEELTDRSEELTELLCREVTIEPHTMRVHFFRYLMKVIDGLLQKGRQDVFDKILEFSATIDNENMPNGSMMPGLAELLDCVEGVWSKVFERLRSNAVFAKRIQSAELVAAFLYFALQKDKSRFGAFLAYVIRERVWDVKGLDMAGFIEMFTRVDERLNRKIFVSMPFGKDKSEIHWLTIRCVVDAINRDKKLEPPLEVERVDQIFTGETFDINEKIINEISSCGYLIADLTYCNPNVYHEIGMVMGRTRALTEEHNYKMLLLLDESASPDSTIVKFNLSSLQQLRFLNHEELERGLYERLIKFYRV